jgi:hypothetical protein
MEHLNEIIDAYLEGSLSTFECQRLEKILSDFPTLNSVLEARRAKKRAASPVHEVEDSDLVSSDLIL